MKTGLKIILMALALTPLVAQAQTNCSIDWFTIDGGGGTSTGGVYTVSGTIGQPDAGTMSGGNYSLTGGFWALYAVQMPGAPFLTIAVTGPNTVVVSWLAGAGSFTLQTNNNLNTSNWVNVGGTVYSNGGTNSVIINPPAGNLFFRLKQ
ncbi:MAG: hypothetical protein ABSB84_07400 [Verrucomicrobiota bacterium]|jgi:hypothetical protein